MLNLANSRLRPPHHSRRHGPLRPSIEMSEYEVARRGQDEYARQRGIVVAIRTEVDSAEHSGGGEEDRW